MSLKPTHWTFMVKTGWFKLWLHEPTVSPSHPAPCTPANVDYSYSCDTGIALLSWDETLGRERFYAYAQSGNHTASCVSTETHCSLPSLLCGRLYDVEVIAVAEHCNSSIPGVTQIPTGKREGIPGGCVCVSVWGGVMFHLKYFWVCFSDRFNLLWSPRVMFFPSAPCAPTNLSVSLVCDNNTAAVSWQHSPGAISYKVTAQGRDGDAKECTSNGTSCDLSHLHCAQTYLITVIPLSSSRCVGIHSTPVHFIAGEDLQEKSLLQQ